MSNWTKVACPKDLPEGKALAVTLGNKRIALFNIHNEYYAIDDECSHAGGSLTEGSLDGMVVTCPWHGATFDVTSGKVLSAPAFDNVGAYRVQVQGDDIQIEIP